MQKFRTWQKVLFQELSNAMNFNYKYAIYTCSLFKILNTERPMHILLPEMVVKMFSIFPPLSPQQLLPCIGKFSELPGILKNHGISPGSVDGILFDVGASSMQYDQRERGFSLSMEGPLDMRMDNGR